MTNHEEPREREVLLPCPFCGNRAAVHPLCEQWKVICPCGVSLAVAFEQGEHAAVVVWNARSPIPPSADAAMVEELRGAREEGYRAGYTHVLGLTRTGVPTSDFERDVGSYMADYVSRRS